MRFAIAALIFLVGLTFACGAKANPPPAIVRVVQFLPLAPLTRPGRLTTLIYVQYESYAQFKSEYFELILNPVAGSPGIAEAEMAFAPGIMDCQIRPLNRNQITLTRHNLPRYTTFETLRGGQRMMVPVEDQTVY